MNAQIQISNVVIRQTENQFYNLNDLHKAAGNNDNHKPSNWLRLQQTQELIAEIEAEGSKACEVINGGKNRGTFVCKELVYAYATWISAKFFLLVIRTFDAVVSGSPKTTTDERTPLRQAVSALVGKKKMDYCDAYTLIHQRFGVAHIDELTHSQIPQAIEYVHRLILDGEVLDKPKNHTVALPEFELVRIAQYLSKTYLSMQLFHELHRALCMVSPHFTKRTREEVENNLPLLRGIVHHLQDYSGSLKDPFFNEQFAKSMQFLGRITPQCLAFR